MNKLEEKQKKRDVDESEPIASDEKKESSIEEQVRREFEYSADHGEPEREQIENELSEEKYMLSSPMNSREDAAFANINVDQRGEAFGIENQRNEPLGITEKIDKRDEDRWALNPASAKAEKQKPIDE